jgi:hypothetical protein
MLLATVIAASLALPATTLTGTARVFPRDAARPRAVFVVTFSKAASSAATEWTKMLRDRGVPVFQVAVIDDVPGFMRGFVIRSMRSGVPEALQDHFWTVTDHRDEWKRLLDARDGKEPHVFMLEDGDRIVHVVHGSASAVKLRELESR